MKVAYDRIEYEKPSVDAFRCVSQVGVPAENALNQHVKAAGQWGDCIEDFERDTDSIDGSLQRRWGRASDQIQSARGALRSIADDAS